MKLLRLCAQQIRLHEALPWNVRTEPGHLLLSKGFMLADQEQIDNLLERGVYVDQDEYEAHLQALEATLANQNPFAVWAQILKRTGQLLRQHKDNPNFGQELGDLSQQIRVAMDDDVEVGTFEMVASDATGYAVSHSLQTAFVASLASGHFGWNASERDTLVRAALTMNIAMLDMQNTLVQQAAPLSPEQRAHIAAHPGKGREMLEAARVNAQDWLRTVEQHHVTTDGRGLPQDRQGLSQLACLVHYADVYLAKLSPRASRPALPVNVAARELYLGAGGAHNPYAAAIIKEMGIFPPGSYVKLANGDTAVVLRRGESVNTPQVNSLISADGWLFPESKPRDTKQAEFKVVAAVPRGNVLIRLDRAKLFGYPSA